jgi:transmembrane sensor
MEKEILIFLLQKHVAGTLTEDEKTELAAFVNRKQSKEAVVAALEDLILEHESTEDYDEKRFIPLITGILKADTATESDEEKTDPDAVKTSRQKSGRKRTWWMIAALAIVAASSLYFYFHRQFVESGPENNNKPVQNDASPGGNKAVLTISDGSTFALDSISSGFITQQGNVQLVKTNHNELKYNISGDINDAILFNTVSTPRGGQYTILLSDGSRVKLNSSSSITYPVRFTGTERNVTITGEAYFEITHNASMPFKVRVYDMEVEVQGTQFNINAYTDEPAMKTTLLRGSLKLSKNSTKRILQPMQQGQFDNEGNYTLEKDIDVNEVIAWKDGLFEFSNTELKTVMRELGRWYDVDIIYEVGSPVDQPVSCEIKRNVNLSEVLKLLQKNDIRCRIEEKTLFVLR